MSVSLLAACGCTGHWNHIFFSELSAQFADNSCSRRHHCPAITGSIAEGFYGGVPEPIQLKRAFSISFRLSSTSVPLGGVKRRSPSLNSAFGENLVKEISLVLP